ncbi:MAG: sigma-54-dependent Fis family transcriptional regulator [Candidatus Wallbacteria bacterium]|nr:sigma-54-dependent Fis family transcriptional regulator [Candidatus Wallbacteria bacterium]
MKSRLLLVEDESAMRQTLEEVFRKENFTVFACSTARDAREVFQREMVHVALVDVRLPDSSGIELFRELHAQDAATPCVLMTAFPQTRDAVQAVKEGAYDYIVKPFELAQLKLLVAKASEYMRLQSEVRHLRDHTAAAGQFLGQSAQARRLLELVERVAASSGTHVLVRGESGAGKELVSQLVHRLSPRKNGPFVVLNCSALPEELVEAELFGYEKGAYTDARAGKKGLLELADDGTLFLDEIGDMPLGLQPKLLRVLDGSPFRRIGGLRNLQVDTRFLAATNRDLELAVREGRFRSDLLYRLKVFEIRVPALRERREDIPMLVEHFLRTLSAAMGRHGAQIDPEALELLGVYDWPGNVRELKNVLERALILANSARVGVEELPAELRQGAEPIAGDWSLESAKWRHVQEVLARCGENRTEAARLLDISRSTLKEMLRQRPAKGRK